LGKEKDAQVELEAKEKQRQFAREKEQENRIAEEKKKHKSQGPIKLGSYWHCSKKHPNEDKNQCCIVCGEAKTKEEKKKKVFK